MSAATSSKSTRSTRGRAQQPAAWLITAVVFVGFLFMVGPFYWMLVASTHATADIFSSTPALLPGDQLWKNLTGLLSKTTFGQSVTNSIVVSVSYTVLAGLICIFGGYAFAKFSFRGKQFIFAVIIASLALPTTVTLVPLFQIMVAAGLLNTYPAVILPNLALPFGIFLMRQALGSVPDELIDAGRIDGAGEFSVLFKIVLPTMRPSLAALAIFLFLGVWNDFVWPLVILQTESAYTIPVALASLQGLNTTDYGQLLTGTTISVLPVAGLFLVLQRQFVAGLLAGAVKQ